MPFGSELSKTTATSSLRGVPFGKFLGFLGPRFLVCPSVLPLRSHFPVQGRVVWQDQMPLWHGECGANPVIAKTWNRNL